MSLASSLNVGVSALRAYSEGIQVVSNNIANVNTVGYKASHAQYSDTFSNILRPLVPNENNTAVKIAPTQVGGGVQVESVAPVFSQGTIQVTNSNSDLAIAGNGFFRVKNPQTGQYFVTRAGNFRVDADGYLVTQQGYRVQGAYGAKTKVVYDATDKSYDVKGQQDNAKVTIPSGITNKVIVGAATTLGNYSFTVPSSSGLSVGMPISGSGIATGAKITAISGTTITMSKAGTATNTNTTITAALKTVDSGSLTLTIPVDYARADLAKGMVITGPGISSGTTIETFSGNIKKVIPASATSLSMTGVGGAAGAVTLSADTTDGLAPGMILSSGSACLTPGSEVVSVDSDGIHFTINNPLLTVAADLTFVAAGTKTLDSSTNVLKLSDVSYLEVGMKVSGAGIPSGSYIGSISDVTNLDGTKDVTLLDAAPQTMSGVSWSAGDSTLTVPASAIVRIGDTISIPQDATGATITGLTLNDPSLTTAVGDTVSFDETFAGGSYSIANNSSATTTTITLGAAGIVGIKSGDKITWPDGTTGTVNSVDLTAGTFTLSTTLTNTQVAALNIAAATGALTVSLSDTVASDSGGGVFTLTEGMGGTLSGSVTVTTERTVTAIASSSTASAYNVLSFSSATPLLTTQASRVVTSFGSAVYPTGNSYSAVSLAFGDQTVVLSDRPTVDSFDGVTFAFGTNYTPASSVGDVKIAFTESENFDFYDTNGDLLTGISLKAAESNMPKIRTFNVGTSGDINIILSNGQTFTAGTVLLQSFKDPGALTREGDNLFSGITTAGPYNGDFTSSNISALTPSNGGLGAINGGALELSNVDLGEEFSTMITTQRAFQAGSRVITTTDQMLEEAVNLKR